MSKLRLCVAFALFHLGFFSGVNSVLAQDIHFVIATTHPPSLPWVSLLRDEFIPQLEKKVKLVDPQTKITWTKAWGSLYKWHDSLTGVKIGLSDIGWVGSVWESAKLPLANITYNLPFITDDLISLLKVVNELHENIPEIQKEWERNNVKFLGATGVDTYHLLTKFPVKNFSDLKGKKILAPGAARLWLTGSGAIPVNGALTTYYTQMKTGAADGALTILTGAYPFRLHEVAPYLTLVGLGAQSVGALVVNLDRWKAMPLYWKTELRRLAKNYSIRSAQVATKMAEKALANLGREGALISGLPLAEREKWIEATTPLGKNWVLRNEEKSLPARKIVIELMDGLRKENVKPKKAWDRAL